MECTYNVCCTMYSFSVDSIEVYVIPRALATMTDTLRCACIHSYRLSQLREIEEETRGSPKSVGAKYRRVVYGGSSRPERLAWRVQ